MAYVVLDRVQKLFGSVEAVKDVSLEVSHGEFLVLVGPSGCGKSTTLRMIAGLEDISGGEIRFDDVVVNDMSPRLRNVAMVFQSYALYPHMSVRRNMAFALEQRGYGKADIEEAVTRTARMLDIQELLGRKPKELSGGQRQRVAMGRAVVREPDVFLFDEPLSNLDAALRAQMRVEIRKLHRMLGTTVIYVTHDQIEAMTLADRIVVMDHGEVIQVGRPMEIYERPNSKFVAGFVGSPAINFVRGRVQGDDVGRLWVHVSADVRLLVPVERVVDFRLFANKNVEIGVRPEDVHEGQAAPNGTSFEAVVDVVEPTGPDSVVMFSLANSVVSARCKPHGLSTVGERCVFSIDMSKVHLIDPETGRVVRNDTVVACLETET